MTDQAPVRLCCGQRHTTASQCPDGRVMCCLCFGVFEVKDLRVVDGKPENVCKQCAADEDRVRDLRSP